MKRTSLVLVASVLGLMPAFAQQPTPSSTQLQRVMETLAVQRNNALNAQAVAEANSAELRDELAKAQAKIKELTEPKKEAPKK